MQELRAVKRASESRANGLDRSGLVPRGFPNELVRKGELEASEGLVESKYFQHLEPSYQAQERH